MIPTNLPSLNHLRSATTPKDAVPFRVGILIAPGFIPMDMAGIQAVFGAAPGAEIHLLWKTSEAVEGFPNWWTLPTTTFADCPEKLDVLAVPMLPPEILSDPEVIPFIAEKAAKASYVIGICNGVLLLGAAGILKGRRATASYNAIPTLSSLGVTEVVPSGNGTIVDGNLYTAGPGVGSFEAALLVTEAAFGRQIAELLALVLEYDPHPPFNTGNPKNASRADVAVFEAMMAPLESEYKRSALVALKTAEA
ncbi:dihydroxy-acid dehydratase [Kaistia sp. 32K]|uniref:DJ-1/PfpI family protein n=1 Tax=Kaistia sp. 32K TaxID=2795690 RepID=UPI0019162E4C|nr:DJ-1/PfpI family protein [Kaistia sp. 32K]BCP53805.1 dihydroxy-acid dehydratase [Kaistia sp. 32K]